MESLGGQVGQDAMQGMGAGPVDGRPNMLASIQSYLNRLQQEPNPPVLLPSLSYPPGQGELPNVHNLPKYSPGSPLH